MEGTAVKLIIKTPNQQIKDQIVNCDIGWTIGRLKEYLSEVYPSKPEMASQKLIYSGQLLNDSTCLKDVLRLCDGQEDQAYTVHLVYASQKVSAQNIVESTSVISSVRSAVEHARLNNTNNVQNQGQNVNNVTIQHTPTQLYSTQQYFDPRNSQQIAWMQQAYTHYFTQYMQLMAAQGIQLQTSIPYVQQMNVDTNDSVQNTHGNNTNNNNNNNVGDEQQQPAAQDADINGGNGAGEDGAFNRNWLDFFYTVSRIFVLLSIVYFYSSPLRFLIVTFLGFAMYLYQGGFFRVQPILLPENNNGRVDRVDNNNQVLQNEAGGPQPVAQQQNGQLPTVQTEVRTNANEEHEEERPGALAFTWTFFSTFFASLIPDQPHVM
ncbi:PREDICTED: homocysteine-responsive endoplasmic reticulum-resident ubiquitin-like domain member 2 protein [Dufourea novaeangliae]|uniref:Homocysteine-responsive endoplasmic reticulum-resident ubiquitin-like domain member 2 protein n=1 Tax=Dufourea novaeangliae TaxID=178035 RepID=A0A154PKK5_DUFNO|nr:PREDICTED: homocysteine-responsive endoplasmic reticulum-resident ubiquitin-like domain member 2 protein [Dufourea novaeangliae]KZC11760.1 Homocysteine-responsive endoplasmic reticulum-resident ubiquitin-like domain member 2 protein [Dufourea novaeangliae]